MLAAGDGLIAYITRPPKDHFQLVELISLTMIAHFWYSVFTLEEWEIPYIIIYQRAEEVVITFLQIYH